MGKIPSFLKGRREVSVGGPVTLVGRGNVISSIQSCPVVTIEASNQSWMLQPPL